MRHRKPLFIALFAVIVAAGIFGAFEHHRRLRFSQRTACVSNIVQLQLAKELYAYAHGLTNGSVIPLELILPNLGYTPHCAMGGTYALNPVGAMPTCSYTGVTRWKGRAWRHEMQ